MINYNINRTLHLSMDLYHNCCDLAGRTSIGDDATNVKNILFLNLNKTPDIMFTCTINRQLVGFIAGRVAQPPNYVDGISNNSVAIDCFCTNGPLIDKKLLNAYTRYAKRNSIDSLFVYSESSQRALKFYKSNGFITVGWNHLMGKSL